MNVPVLRARVRSHQRLHQIIAQLNPNKETLVYVCCFANFCVLSLSLSLSPKNYILQYLIQIREISVQLASVVTMIAALC